MKSRTALLNPFRNTIATLLLLTLSPVWIFAQASQETQQNGQTGASSTRTERPPDGKASSNSAKTAADQAMSPEDARQAQFIADTQKLYQLAQELKVEVDKSNKNTLSIAVTKKAEEIEKLARSLKERMRKE